MYFLKQATDESEASEEEVENQLRKMDRVWESLIGVINKKQCLVYLFLELLFSN